MEDDEDLGPRIKRQMDERGFTARSLADSAELNPTGVRDILTGRSKNPTLNTLRKIALALGVDIRAILPPPIKEFSETDGFALNPAWEKYADRSIYSGALDRYPMFQSFPPPSYKRSMEMTDREFEEVTNPTNFMIQGETVFLNTPFSIDTIVVPFIFKHINDRLSPAYDRDDYILVHPSMPISPGMDVVIFNRYEQAINWLVDIGRVNQKTSSIWNIRQFYPLADRDVPNSDDMKAMAVIGKYRAR